MSSKVKCVVVGDSAIGKTSLLFSFTTNTFPDNYAPTIFDCCATTLMVDGEKVTLSLWDIGGQEYCNGVRSLLYVQTDVFLVCFSVLSSISFENVGVEWVPELRTSCPDAKIILVGTQADLRDDHNALRRLKYINQEPITRQMGVELAREIGGEKYMECSALTQRGLKQVFEEAIRASVGREGEKGGEKGGKKGRKKERKGCVLL